MNTACGGWDHQSTVFFLILRTALGFCSPYGYGEEIPNTGLHIRRLTQKPIQLIHHLSLN